MNETVKNILILLSAKKENYFTRAKIEEQMPRVKKRAILNALALLAKHKRVKREGLGTSTVYLFSHIYNQDFEHKLYLYQNQICIG